MKLTIVLTLKGRDEFTYRWMSYMNEICCPYKILIADGGDNHDIENSLIDNKNYPNLNYIYIRYPYDENINIFYKKLEDIISKVQTEYILLADNDDFYLIDCIPGLIEFLDGNLDYVAARGTLVNFEVFDEKWNSKGQARGVRYKAYSVYSPSIENESPLIRINSLCKGMSEYNYYCNWYAITRTNVLQKIWRNLMELEVKDVIIMEIILHVILVNMGKIKIINSLFYLRQINTSVVGDILTNSNEFLERCIINNSLADFAIAVQKFMSFDGIYDKNQVLKSIAGWLNIFVYNIHSGHQLRSTKFYKYKKFIKDLPILGLILRYFFDFIKMITLQSPQTVKLRVKEIEAFIVK